MKLLLLLGALAHFSFAKTILNETLSRNQAVVQILWDDRGVPHIFGETVESAIYAFGYAQALSHGNLLMELFAESQGISAELFGGGLGDVRLFFDIQIWADEIPSTAQTLYAAMDEESRGWCEAFAAGFNDFISENPDDYDPLFMRVLPINGQAVFTHAYRILTDFAFGGSKSGSAKEHRNEEEMAQRKGKSPNVIFSSDVDYDARFANVPEELRSLTGSNGWAIGGDKTDGNGAKLVINPHLPYFGFYTWYEVQLYVEEYNLDAYGAALIGMPSLVIGFNDYLGWTHTVNVIQGWVNYQVQLVDDDHYIFDGAILPITRNEYLVRNLNQAGEIEEHIVVVERTIHGQIYSRNGLSALANRRAGQDRANVFKQYFDMTTATTMDEFKDAMRPLQQGYFTTIAASRDDDIFIVDNGWIPRRNPDLGDWNFWRSPVDGTTSDTLFQDIHTFDELPQMSNPESGFVQNANEPPWTASFPTIIDPNDYPSYMAPEPFMGFRPQISARLMMENTNITFEELDALKHSCIYEAASHVLPELIVAIDEFGTTDDIRQIREIFANWDGALDNDSVGAIPFLEFQSRAGFGSLFVNPWSLDDPLGTPNTLRDPEAAVASLQSAIDFMNSQNIPLDVAYGEVNTVLDINEGILPGNGGEDTFRNTVFLAPGLPPLGGDSYVAVVEFTQNGARAKNLIGYGNASQGPHYFDQWGSYSRKELQDVLRERDDIIAVLERVDNLQYNRK